MVYRSNKAITASVTPAEAGVQSAGKFKNPVFRLEFIPVLFFAGAGMTKYLILYDSGYTVTLCHAAV